MLFIPKHKAVQLYGQPWACCSGSFVQSECQLTAVGMQHNKAGNSGQLVLVKVVDAYYNEIYADPLLLIHINLKSRDSSVGITRSYNYIHN